MPIPAVHSPQARRRRSPILLKARPSSLSSLLFCLLFTSGCALFSIRNIDARVAVPAPPPTGFSHELLDRTLRAHVVDGRVDYEALSSNDDDLRAYVALMGPFGPRSTPNRFPTREHRLAYYINAYNALTLLGIVHHWPVESVHQVKGWITPSAGFGFFYGLRFKLDGERINLYNLENEILREQFDDARIHAVINCASVSCPKLADRAFKAEDLEARLEEATRLFTSSPPHVQMHPEEERVELSPIYDWFRGDFEAHASNLGLGSATLDFIAHYADDPIASQARLASTEDWAIHFSDYDWGLNGRLTP